MVEDLLAARGVIVSHQTVRGHVAFELARSQIDLQGILAGEYAGEKAANARGDRPGEQDGAGNLGDAENE